MPGLLGMDFSPSSVFALPQLLFLAVVTAGLIAIISHWYRQRTAMLATMNRAAATAGKIVYEDAPTVRVADAQRVDRMRKVVHLAVGEHVDVLHTPAGLPPRFRVTLKSIGARAGSDVARLVVEFGGTPISCGPLVTELATNDFEVPRAGRDEPRSGLFHYFENGNALDFMRIKVRHLDSAARTAELDVLQVCGHWPSTP